MLCCISGCPNRTLVRSYKMCTTHWKEYGGPRESREPWVMYLMQVADAEQKRIERNYGREVSLDYGIATGQINEDEMEIYTGPEKGPTQRRRRGRTVQRSNSSGVEFSTR